MEVPKAFKAAFNRDKVPPAPGQDHESKTFKASCHCKNIQYAITIPTSMLPLNALICGCSHCRQSHGTFSNFQATLPLGMGPEWANGSINMSVYKTPGTANGSGQRLFCPTCGSHFGHYEPWINQWALNISLFDEPFWKFTTLAFSHSPRDGGLTDWIPKVIGGQELEKVTLPHDQPTEYQPEVGEDGEERLRAECFCGGVSFTIPRPSQAVIDDENMGKYVSPSDPTKWKALLDFCRDCRLLSGAHVVPWILVPRAVLHPEVPPALVPYGTLKTYESSARNTRSFCGRCGATVFIASKLRAPSAETAVVNVGMGILRAPEGSRAENWVTWRTGKPAFTGPDDNATSFEPEFTQAVCKAHKQWGVEKYGEAPDFDVV